MKTKKFASSLFIILLFSTAFLYAQRPEKHEMRKKVDAYKIAFITQELNLTTAEAQVFWPVYNEFQTQEHALRKAMDEQVRNKVPNLDDLSDKEVESLIDEHLIHEQKILDLKKKYHQEFKKVLPVKKVAKLYLAEHKFKKYLLEKLGDRKPRNNRPPKGGGGPMPDIMH